MKLDLGIGQRRFDCLQAGDHALDVAVDGRGLLVEGDGPDGGGGVGPNAGQGTQGRLVLGKVPFVPVGHRLGAGVEIARAGVVAEAGPG